MSCQVFEQVPTFPALTSDYHVQHRLGQQHRPSSIRQSREKDVDQQQLWQHHHSLTRSYGSVQQLDSTQQTRQQNIDRPARRERDLDAEQELSQDPAVCQQCYHPSQPGQSVHQHYQRTKPQPSTVAYQQGQPAAQRKPVQQLCSQTKQQSIHGDVTERAQPLPLSVSHHSTAAAAHSPQDTTHPTMEDPTGRFMQNWMAPSVSTVGDLQQERAATSHAPMRSMLSKSQSTGTYDGFSVEPDFDSHNSITNPLLEQSLDIFPGFPLSTYNNIDWHNPFQPEPSRALDIFQDHQSSFTSSASASSADLTLDPPSFLSGTPSNTCVPLTPVHHRSSLPSSQTHSKQQRRRLSERPQARKSSYTAATSQLPQPAAWPGTGSVVDLQQHASLHHYCPVSEAPHLQSHHDISSAPSEVCMTFAVPQPSCHTIDREATWNGAPASCAPAHPASVNKASLIGARLPFTLLVDSYANSKHSDVYQNKASTLAATYTHYRRIGGNGSCGWRAVCFGWFELLLSMQDSVKITLEEARIKSLANFMIEAGYNASLLERDAESFLATLRHVRHGMENGVGSQILLDLMNDEATHQPAITHLRTLTAAWLLTHENHYRCFLDQQTVEQYTKLNVLSATAELDKLSLSALAEVLLSPAGVSVEVLYLDQTPGNDVTRHRIDSPAGIQKDFSVITLLHRHGQYDLLYAAPNESLSNPNAYLQIGTAPTVDPIIDLTMSDCMTTIPGISYASFDQALVPVGFPDHSLTGLLQPPFTSMCTLTESPYLPNPPSMINSYFDSHPNDRFDLPPKSATPVMVPPPSQLPTSSFSFEVPFRPNAAAREGPSASRGVAQDLPFLQPPVMTGPFRPSVWQFDHDNSQSSYQLPLKTSPFKNSHFNTSHFLNPNFQPEQWDPFDFYVTVAPDAATSRGRNKK